MNNDHSTERLEYQKRQSNNPQVEYIFKGGG